MSQIKPHVERSEAQGLGHPKGPTRPVLRWHGGKWRLAPWIIGHFPPHRVYVEPFGGAGSVLMRKPRAYAEVWNDLDGEVVNLFQVLRSERAGALIEALRLTPFARAEFDAAYQPTDDPVERARRLVIRSYQGRASNSTGHRTGFNIKKNMAGTHPARDWANLPGALGAVVDRLRGVGIECRDAIEVMAHHDEPFALHYVDPPYLPETRDAGSDYAHELSDADHARLLEALRGLTGMVVLSGYPAPLYDDALGDWRRVETAALADGARARTEVLWLNPACCAALDADQMPLLAGMGR